MAYQHEMGESEPPPTHDEQTELLRLIEHRLREQAKLPETPPPGTRKLNYLERKAIQTWIDTLRRDEHGRPEIGLPWREGEPHFCNNAEGSMNWLKGLQRRLKQSSPEEHATFQKVFLDWIKEKIIRIVPDDEAPPKQENFIPYFGVKREDKATSKMRPVMNAAAIFYGKSLNNALLSGPNLLKDVRVSLLRFSKHTIALVGDIKQMFLQIGMRREDRAFLRFHWVDPGGATKVCEFLRWPFGLTSSPSAACWIVQHHAEELKEKYPLAYGAVMNNMMMDDVLISVSTEDEAIELRRQLRDCLGEACMTICKWASNSNKLLAEVPEEDRAASIDFEGLDYSNKLHELAPIIKTLGMVWLSPEDLFTYNFAVPEDDGKPLTNRKMLSHFNGLYDPLGFVVPYQLKARRIFQASQKETLLWDAPVSESIKKDYAQWVSQLPLLKTIKKPRLLTRDYEAAKKSIIIFSDASKEGIGATGYLRCEYNDGHVDVHLCYSRAKLTPINRPTIPRLELEGCMMSLDIARIMLTAFDDLTWSDIYFWSDSQTALAWIYQESSNLILYVSNRISQIHDLTHPNQWRFVAGEDNPADLASRGGDPREIRDHATWFQGPDWLKKPQEEWPSQDKFPETEKVREGMRVHALHIDCDVDYMFPSEFSRLLEEAANAKPDYLEEEAAAAANSIQRKDVSPLDLGLLAANNSIYLERIEASGAKYRTMVNMVARVIHMGMRAMNTIDCKGYKNSLPYFDKKVKFGEVTPTGFHIAERILLRWLQAKHFKKELEYLRVHHRLPVDHRLASVHAGIAPDGLLRVMSRLRYVSEMKLDERANIILPFNSPITDAIMRDFHKRIVVHAGGRGTLASEFGTRFWLNRPGPKADEIIAACHVCRKRDIKPRQHDFAPLPDARVKTSGPSSLQVFRDIGIDLFGPYMVYPRRVPPEVPDPAAPQTSAVAAPPPVLPAPRKQGRPPKNAPKLLPPEPKKKGRPKKAECYSEKRWIMIFACMKIRAIHCEKLQDCTEEEILMALDRFCMTRGTPETIYCDRGSYFIGAENTLRCHWDRINEENPIVRKHFADIQWYFNPGCSPHYGGHYERLIGLVKKAMQPLYRPPNLTDSILHTVMIKAVNLVNSRPLAVRITPSAADPQPITPNHFLRGRFYRRLADIGEGGSFFRDWKYIQDLENKFFQGFLKGCVPLYNYDYSKDSTKIEFKKGDTVWLLKKSSPTHGNWPLVKVSEVETSRDGKIRTVHVMYEDKDVKTAIKDLALVVSEPEATTNIEGGIVVLPQFPEDKTLYESKPAGRKYIW
jgi:hypothetical protein